MHVGRSLWQRLGQGDAPIMEIWKEIMSVVQALDHGVLINVNINKNTKVEKTKCQGKWGAKNDMRIGS